MARKIPRAFAARRRLGGEIAAIQQEVLGSVKFRLFRAAGLVSAHHLEVEGLDKAVESAYDGI